MQLKDYQQKALLQVEAYLQQLSEWRKKADHHPDLEINFPERAWAHLEDLKEHQKKYHSKNTGIGQPLPNFCLKIPTGGGKTLLAIKTLDLTHTHYLRRQTGLVLWIVP